MEVEQRDSCFRFMLQSHLFAKKTTGIWGTCTVRSHQPVFHIVKCSSAAGDGLLLGFSVAPMLFILCRSVRPGGGGFRPFGECWNISVLKLHIAMKPLSFNGCRSLDHIEDALNVEHQFAGADGLKRAFKHQLVVDIQQGGTALHVQVFVSLPNAWLNWEAPVCAARPNSGKKQQSRWSYLVSELL